MSAPNRLVKELVDMRDRQRCVRCGKSLYNIPGSRHHRKLRSHASKAEMHLPSNLIDLCGSGTTGCHGWVHSHPQEAREHGWIVSAYQTPTEVAVDTSQYGRVLLTNEGTVTPLQMEEEE